MQSMPCPLANAILGEVTPENEDEDLGDRYWRSLPLSARQLAVIVAALKSEKKLPHDRFVRIGHLGAILRESVRALPQEGEEIVRRIVPPGLRDPRKKKTLPLPRRSHPPAHKLAGLRRSLAGLSRRTPPGVRSHHCVFGGRYVVAVSTENLR